MKEVEVVAAVIKKDDKFLCVQRGENKFDYIAYKFEFPGGKVEAGEKPEETIKREIKEELLIDIDVKESVLTVNHTYPDFKIKMHSFICLADTDKIQLTEHIALKWLKKEELDSLDWAAADIPIVEKLMQ